MLFLIKSERRMRYVGKYKCMKDELKMKMEMESESKRQEEEKRKRKSD